MVGARIAIVECMGTTQRASIAVALLMLAWVATPVGAEDEALSVATGNLGVVAGLGAMAVRVVGRLSEPGALLLWGTGLAAASLALSRKHPSGK